MSVPQEETKYVCVYDSLKSSIVGEGESASKMTKAQLTETNTELLQM